MIKYSEFLWEKIGAISISLLIGGIYGLIIAPIIIYLFPQVTMWQVVKVFCLVFSTIGLISSNFLINATVGVIYTILGFIFFIFEGGSMVRVVEKSFRNSIWFTLLGLICGLMVAIIYK